MQKIGLRQMREGQRGSIVSVCLLYTSHCPSFDFLPGPHWGLSRPPPAPEVGRPPRPACPFGRFWAKSCDPVFPLRRKKP